MSDATRYVLRRDVLLIPSAELDDGQRARAGCADHELVLTLPHSRATSVVLSSEAAKVVTSFREPLSVAEAVIAYSADRGVDAQSVLQGVFPVLAKLRRMGALAIAGSAAADGLGPRLAPGVEIGGARIVRCVHAVEDTELYECRDEAGRRLACKLAGEPRDEMARAAVKREVAALRQLAGRPAPELRGAGAYEGAAYVLMEWCDGRTVDEAMHAARREASDADPIRLIMQILAAYTELHEHGVVHGDVHARNLVAQWDGRVRIIDYALATVPGLPAAPRGAVAHLHEPEYVHAFYGGRDPPVASERSDQYGLGALAFEVLAGTPHVRVEGSVDDVFSRIADASPLSFEEAGGRPWPAVERVLARALAKRLDQRFGSVREFAVALSRAAQTPPTPRAGAVATGAAVPVAGQLVRQLIMRLHDVPRARDALHAPTASVASGAAGLCLFLYRIACVRQDAPLLDLARAWSDAALGCAGAGDSAFYNEARSLTPERLPSVSLFHRAPGIHCVAGLVAIAAYDKQAAGRAIDEFIASSRGGDGALDVTLGRSGTLLGTAGLLSAARGVLDDTRELEAFGHATFEELAGRLEALGAVSGSTELPFLGIAHGWAGVLYALMRWCLESGRPLPATIANRLDELAACAGDSGGTTWRRSADPSDQARWPGWCHGAAGYVHLFTLAHRLIGNTWLLDLAARSGQTARDGGDEDGYTLCCGAAGRGFALLSLYKETGEREWLEGARRLAARCAARAADPHLVRNSLYSGDVGIALLCAELEAPAWSSMPLFESERFAAPE
jgi:hypothetical protein